MEGDGGIEGRVGGEIGEEVLELKRVWECRVWVYKGGITPIIALRKAGNL